MLTIIPSYTHCLVNVFSAYLGVCILYGSVFNLFYVLLANFYLS